MKNKLTSLAASGSDLPQRLAGLRVRFDNMRKLFPGSQCYDSWIPRFKRLWSGKLWYLEVRGYTLVFDWRGGPDAVLRDLSA